MSSEWAEWASPSKTQRAPLGLAIWALFSAWQMSCARTCFFYLRYAPSPLLLCTALPRASEDGLLMHGFLFFHMILASRLPSMSRNQDKGYSMLRDRIENYAVPLYFNIFVRVSLVVLQIN